jgi:hypothetical protein
LASTFGFSGPRCEKDLPHTKNIHPCVRLSHCFQMGFCFAGGFMYKKTVLQQICLAQKFAGKVRNSLIYIRKI